MRDSSSNSTNLVIWKCME